MFENLDFTPGRVTYNDLCINLELPLVDQTNALKEDLFQVEYDKNYVLDIGWYPSFSPLGSFRILIVKDFDWENPVFERVCCTIDELVLYVQECANTIKHKL